MTPTPIQVLSNATTGAGSTQDTDTVYCRGRRSVQFILSGTDTTHTLAGASSFQLLIVPHEALSATPIAVSIANAGLYGLEVVGGTNSDGATPGSGKVITVVPDIVTSGNPAAPGIPIYKLGARFTNGASALTDFDVFAIVQP